MHIEYYICINHVNVSKTIMPVVPFRDSLSVLCFSHWDLTPKVDVEKNSIHDNILLALYTLVNIDMLPCITVYTKCCFFFYDMYASLSIWNCTKKNNKDYNDLGCFPCGTLSFIGIQRPPAMLGCDSHQDLTDPSCISQGNRIVEEKQ